LKPEGIYLTHFSRVDDVDRLGVELVQRIDALVALAEAAPGEGEARKNAIRAAIEREFLKDAEAEIRQRLPEVLRVDLELNAQGLAWWLEHR